MTTAVASEQGSPAAATPALEIRNLEVLYNRVVRALQGASLTVPRGEIVALLGPNGAGKSTTLRAVSGLLDVHDGEVVNGRVLVEDADLTGHPSSDLVRAGLVHVLEGRQVFPDLSVEENLLTGAFTRRRVRNAVRQRLAELLDRFPLLGQRRHQRAGYLSGGEQQMLAIGRALMADPRILLLDEPSLGLAPQLVEAVRDVIIELNRAGTSILLVEQNAALALSIAHYGYVLENGRIVLDGPASELLDNEDVREFYLGLAGGQRRRYRDVKHYRRKKRWLS